ncbi:MAG: RNA polymerase sigma factor region1.1 domain-containing protein, partial [Ramlibacter sp.]
MPAQKSAKSVKPAKPADRKSVKSSAPPAAKAQLKVVKSDKKAVLPVPTKSIAKADKAPAKEETKKTAKAAVAPADETVKKKPGRPPKAVVEGEAPKAAGAKRGRKPKDAAKPGLAGGEDEDLGDIEAEFADAEPVVAEAAAVTEKVKPLRMKISKAKERALMKEFGLDEAVLSEEDMAKRRQRLKMLITLGKTRGSLTHAEITDHLPEKLVDAETLEVVVSML